MHMCAHICVCVCGCWVSDRNVSTVLRIGVCVRMHVLCVCICALVRCRKVGMWRLLKLDIHMYICGYVYVCVFARACVHVFVYVSEYVIEYTLVGD